MGQSGHASVRRSIHDDSVYFVCAKAWANGQGHRIISLPGEPWQTKYPPLYPLLLSVVWRIAPEFPSNLKLATLFAWILLPPLLWLVRVLYRRYGFPAWAAWLMIAVLAVNPYVQLFSRSLFSEIPFTLMLLGVLLTVASMGGSCGSPGRSRISHENSGAAAIDRHPVCLCDAARVALRGCFYRNDDAVDCRMEFMEWNSQAAE